MCAHCRGVTIPFLQQPAMQQHLHQLLSRCHSSPCVLPAQPNTSGAVWGEAVGSARKQEAGEGSVKGLMQGLAGTQGVSMLDRFLPKLKR
jgi:hypothetical protein